MSGSAPSLAQLRVAVTRPAAQAESLCMLLEQHGAEVLRLPLQRIEALPSSAALEHALQQARSADQWIFTSANAVRHARGRLGAAPKPTIAVGPATAAALAAQGDESVTQPADEHNSEGVLALPQLQQVRGQQIALISGVGGRDMIEQTLRARGASVERIAVYRRVDVSYAPLQLETLLAPVQAIVITNGEALQRLAAAMTGAARAALLEKQLVVPSRRVVEQASQLGFTVSPLIPERLLDAACLQCLERWWSGRGRTTSK